MGRFLKPVVFSLLLVLSSCQTEIPPFPVTITPVPEAFCYVGGIRLKALGEGGQSCSGGDHYARICVYDYNANKVDNREVVELNTGWVGYTRDGCVEFVMGKEGCYRFRVGNAVTPELCNSYPPFELLAHGGYCRCLGNVSLKECEEAYRERKSLFAFGHYVYYCDFICSR